MKNTNSIKEIRHHHFFVSRRLSLTQELVEEVVKSHLGDVNIVDWHVEDQTHLEGGGMLSQRNPIVVVEYREK